MLVQRYMIHDTWDSVFFQKKHLDTKANNLFCAEFPPFETIGNVTYFVKPIKYVVWSKTKKNTTYLEPLFITNT